MYPSPPSQIITFAETINSLMNLKLIFVVTLLSSDQELKKDVGR